MSHELVVRAPCVADQDSTGRRTVAIAGLPDELLLAIWYRLPALERTIVSQACRQWRNIALSNAELWSRVAFVSRWCPWHLAAQDPPSIYQPRGDSTNIEFLKILLPRSGLLPLKVTIMLGPESLDVSEAFAALKGHSIRVTSIDLEGGSHLDFQLFVRMCVDSMPALRTITAKIRDQENPCEPPLRSYPDTRFALLSQIHFSIGIPTNRLFFSDLNAPLPSMQELTLAPSDLADVITALHACPNLSRLNLIMSRCYTQISSARLREFVDPAAAVRTICVMDIPHTRDEFVLRTFNDPRFFHLILDYSGYPCVPGSTWNPELPSPSNALADEVHLAVRLRENVYEIELADSGGHRRKILIDYDTIRLAPGFADCYVADKTVLSATVDALAWDYFIGGLPDTPYDLPDLTILVQREAAELDGVSLAKLSGLRKLRIDVSRSAIRFDTEKLRGLVHPCEKKLLVLSLPSNACYDDIESLSLLACTVEQHAFRAQF